MAAVAPALLAAAGAAAFFALRPSDGSHSQKGELNGDASPLRGR
jgi:hypothetical protein